MITGDDHFTTRDAFELLAAVGAIRVKANTKDKTGPFVSPVHCTDLKALARTVLVVLSLWGLPADAMVEAPCKGICRLGGFHLGSSSSLPETGTLTRTDDHIVPLATLYSSQAQENGERLESRRLLEFVAFAQSMTIVSLMVLLTVCLLIHLVGLSGALGTRLAPDPRVFRPGPAAPDLNMYPPLPSPDRGSESRSHPSEASEMSLRPRLPRIRFPESILEELARATEAFCRIHPLSEIIYTLVGKYMTQGSKPEIQVSGFLGPGPNAELTPFTAAYDRPHQQALLAILRIIDRDVCYVGLAHLHPGRLDRCSSIDYKADRQRVGEARDEGLVFVILNRHGTERGNALREHAVARDGFKFSFYHMSRSTGLEYVPFRPDLNTGVLHSVPPLLRELAAAAPLETRMEFSCVSSLYEYTAVLVQITLPEGTTAPCVVLTHRLYGYAVMVAYPYPSLSARRVFVDLKTEMVEWAVNHEESPSSRQPSLVEIVMEIEENVQVDYRHRLSLSSVERPRSHFEAAQGGRFLGR